MKIKLNTGICQIINVGMYESIIDPRYVFENEQYRVQFSDLLTKEEKEYFDSKCFYEWNSEAYDNLVAGYAMEIIKSYFDKISSIIKISLCDIRAINSPQYYNNRTDELDFYIEIDEEELNKVLSNVISDNKFFKWAERFKSYSGFISSMPYRKEDYIKAIKGVDIERALAMYLTYLYDKQNNFEEHEFGHTYNLYELIASSHGITEFINDKKAVEIYCKAYDETA